MTQLQRSFYYIRISASQTAGGKKNQSDSLKGKVKNQTKTPSQKTHTNQTKIHHTHKSP